MNLDMTRTEEPVTGGRMEGKRRRDLYAFGTYNPYRHTREELPLVQENLKRLKGGEVDLHGFMRRTPCFPRWKEEHLRQSRVLLVSCGTEQIEPARFLASLGHGGTSHLIGDLFQEYFLSWLSLTNCPGEGEICGELGWKEGGVWEDSFPLLARCGKAGYFLSPNECRQMIAGKFLHLKLYPFDQKRGEINPRNEQGREYYQENLKTIRRFCELSETRPGYVFIVGEATSIRQEGPEVFSLDALQGGEEPCRRVADILRIVDGYRGSVQVRISRQPLLHGRNAQIMNLVRAAAYELRPFREGRMGEGA